MARENYDEYKGAVMLWKIIPPFLIVFGITGNIITIIVLFQKRIRISSTSIFLATLAMSDILALATGLLRQWIKYMFHIDIREDLSVIGCKFHWFIVYVVTQFSSWMLVCVTGERVISTIIPHKRRVFCSIRYASIFVCVILCFLFALNVHYLFGYGDIYQQEDIKTEVKICVPTSKRYSQFIIYCWTWIDLCFFYLIPMLCLLIGNTVITYKVLDSQRRSRRAVAPNTNSVTQQQGKASGLRVLLILVSTLFIIFITPIVVYPIGEPYWKDGATQQRLAAMFLFETTANLLMYVNHSINFVIYFLGGSKFRTEVNRVLSCRNARVHAPRQQATELRTVCGIVNQNL